MKKENQWSYEIAKTPFPEPPKFSLFQHTKLPENFHEYIIARDSAVAILTETKRQIVLSHRLQPSPLGLDHSLGQQQSIAMLCGIHIYLYMYIIIYICCLYIYIYRRERERESNVTGSVTDRSDWRLDPRAIRESAMNNGG